MLIKVHRHEIDKLPSTLAIGNQGENDVTIVEVDCSAWLSEFEGATMAATIMLPAQENPLPLVTMLNGNILSIPITWNVSAMAGLASIVIKLLGANGEEKRSDIMYTYIKKGHPIASGEVPVPVQDWVNQATLRLNELDDIEAQTLSFDKATSLLSISGGNTVALNRGLNDEQYNHLSEIMARPYGSWVMNKGAAYYNTPSRDTEYRKKLRVEWGLGIFHLDFFAAATSGIIGTIPPSTQTKPSPKAEVLIEVQAHDGLLYG